MVTTSFSAKNEFIRTAFFGTSDRSIPILNGLKNETNLSLCITKTDSKVGRKQVVKECGVKTWAKSNGIAYLEIDNFKNGKLETVLDALKQAGIDYGVVADFSLIIPKTIIDYFREIRDSSPITKIINVHFSLLPKYRGASPVQFAIKDGVKETGITYHLLDEKMDTGEIINQTKYAVRGTETSNSLYHHLFEVAGTEIGNVIKDYDKGTLLPVKQDETKATYTYSPSNPKSTFIFKEDAYIKWREETVQSIYQKIRAFDPWPIAWTKLKDFEGAEIANGKVILKESVNKELCIKFYEAQLTKEDKLLLTKVQVEGKNKVDWISFKNGYLN